MLRAHCKWRTTHLLCGCFVPVAAGCNLLRTSAKVYSSVAFKLALAVWVCRLGLKIVACVLLLCRPTCCVAFFWPCVFSRQGGRLFGAHNTVMVDDTPRKMKRHPHNVIIVPELVGGESFKQEVGCLSPAAARSLYSCCLWWRISWRALVYASVHLVNAGVIVPSTRQIAADYRGARHRYLLNRI